MKDWKVDLHVLSGWAGGWKNLSKILDYTPKTLRSRAQPANEGAGEELIEKVRLLQDRLSDQHRQHAQNRAHLIMVLQELQQAEDWDDIERIQRRAADMIEATEEPLISILDNQRDRG